MAPDPGLLRVAREGGKPQAQPRWVSRVQGAAGDSYECFSSSFDPVVGYRQQVQLPWSRLRLWEITILCLALVWTDCISLKLSRSSILRKFGTTFDATVGSF